MRGEEIGNSLVKRKNITLCFVPLSVKHFACRMEKGVGEVPLPMGLAPPSPSSANLSPEKDCHYMGGIIV